MLSLLDTITLLIAGSMVGNEFAIAAFAHPVLYRADQHTHAVIAQLLAARLGRFMPFWYAATALLTAVSAWLHRGTPGFPFLLGAAILFVVCILVTVALLVPINNRIANLTPESPYPTWLQDRSRWDNLHQIRVAVLVLAFVLLTVGALR